MPGSLQQVLRNGSFEARKQLRTVAVKAAHAGCPAVVPGQRERRSGDESLVKCKVVLVGVGERTRLKFAELRRFLPLQLDRTGYRGIESLGGRPRARCGQREAGASRSRTSGAHRRPARPPARRKSRSRSAEGVGHEARRRAQEIWCAGPRAQDIRVRNVQVVAGNGDVVVVLDGQGNGIGEAQINLAVLDQIGQAHGVREVRLGDSGGPIHIDRIAQPRPVGL